MGKERQAQERHSTGRVRSRALHKDLHSHQSQENEPNWGQELPGQELPAPLQPHINVPLVKQPRDAQGAPHTILADDHGLQHGLVPTVRRVAPAGLVLVALAAREGDVWPHPALAGADADDAPHQPALGVLLVQVVVLSDAVDEVRDLVGLLQEDGVRGALGQLVDLVDAEELRELLEDEHVDLAAGHGAVQLADVHVRLVEGVILLRAPVAAGERWLLYAVPEGLLQQLLAAGIRFQVVIWVPVWIDRDALQLHIWVTETAAHAGLFDLVPVLLSRRGVGGAVWQPPVVVSILPVIRGGLSRPRIGNADTAVLEAAPTRHYATENGLVRVPGLRQRGAAKALVWGSLCSPRDEGDGLCLAAVGVLELGLAPFPVPHLLGSAAAGLDLGRGATEHLQADIRVPGPGPQGHGLPLPGAAPAQHGSALRYLRDTWGSDHSHPPIPAPPRPAHRDLTARHSQRQRSSDLWEYLAPGLTLFSLRARVPGLSHHPGFAASFGSMLKSEERCFKRAVFRHQNPCNLQKSFLHAVGRGVSSRAIKEQHSWRWSH